jgi:hypothetical protein
MSRLSTTPPAQADELFAALGSLHDGLSEQQSHRAHARLLLLLANHIGDAAVIREAVILSRVGLAGSDDRIETSKDKP